MAKYKVLKQFKDIETGKLVTPKTEVDFTVARADKLNEKGEFLERIEEPKKKKSTPKK